MVAGCPATGTSDWPALVEEAWKVAAKGVGVQIPMPPVGVLVQDPLMMLAALIPVHAARTWGVPPRAAPQFLGAFHRALAVAMAECLRRREELMATAQAVGEGDRTESVLPGPPPSGALPSERRLTVADLLEAERRRRTAPVQLAQGEDVASSSVPVAGPPRCKWLCQQLVAII